MRSNLAGLMAIGLRLGAIGAVAGMGVAALSEQALALENWQFDAGREQLVISVPKGVTPQYYLMAEPARIVLDLPNTEVGAVVTEQSYGGAVRQIRVAQFQPGLARIVMELSPNAVLAPGQVELMQIQGDHNAALQRWTLRPLLAGVTEPTTTAVAPNPVAPSALPPLEPGAVEIPVEAPQAIAQPKPAASSVAVTPSPSAVPAAASAPIQVDFSTPLPATPAELATVGSSAAELSSTSSQQANRPRSASRSTNAPAVPSVVASGAQSFPVPTADGITVPALSTVVANSGTGDAAPDNAASPATPSSTELPTAESPEAAPPNNAASQPRSVSRQRRAAQPAVAQPAEAQPAVSPATPGVIQIIPFGQPLPQ